MTSRRREQILQLLSSRYDGLYLPAGSLVTPAGFAPGLLEPCDHCDGTGQIHDRFGRTAACSRCGGNGRLAYDAMDGLRIPVGSEATTSTARPIRTVKCDACSGDGAHGNGRRCDHCDGQGRLPLHSFDLVLDTAGESDSDPLTAAIFRRDKSGSYHDLEQALAGVRVHVNKPLRFAYLTAHATRALRLLNEVYLPPAERDEAMLRPEEIALIELALAYIDSRMPDPIRVPAAVRANARELLEQRKRARGNGTDPKALDRRNVEIRRLIRQGRPTQWVAQTFGLSVARVNELVRGEDLTSSDA